MAYDSNNSGGNDSEMYEDGPGGSPSPPPETVDKPGDDENKGAPVATLPKSILMGKECKVGDEITLKIEQIGENEVVVGSAGYKDKGDEAEPAAESASETPKDEMDEMMG